MTFSTLASPGVSLQGGGGSGGGGGGTPGGSNTQIQYNSSGTFAGASGLTTNGTELTIASGTKTADAPALNMSQTWNNGATTFTALKFNITDTASAAASLLMDLQVGGSSRFGVLKDGNVYLQGGTSVHFIANSNGGGLACNNAGLNDGTYDAVYSGYGPRFRNSVTIGWAAASTVNAGGGSPDTILTRRAAANLRLGAADAAAPVAQTLSVQSVVAGTTNTAGANLTITGSQGTGTGAGGSIIFQVAPAGSSGSAQNALATALTIGADRSATFAGSIIGSYFTLQPAGYTNALLLYDTGGGPAVALTSNGDIRWSSSATNAGSTADVILRRDAANTLALRNGASAQTFNVYNTFTDASNYERGKIAWSSNVLQIGTEKAGTGTARALELQTDGTTRLTISTAGNATVTGWIKSNLYFDAPAALLGGNGGIYFGTAGANGSQVQSTGAGVIALGNYGGSDFNRIQFGGTTSSFPALKRSSTTLQARLADDSAFAGFASANMQAATAYTVATLPGTPGTGMIARVTDALAPTIGATVTGGGAAYALVNYNGANWTVIGV